MKTTLPLIAIASVLAGTLSLSAAPAATPPAGQGPKITLAFPPDKDAPPAPATAQAPAAAVPTVAGVPVPLMPKALEGVVTPAEYRSYVTYQMGLRDNPEYKALETKILARISELQVLQDQLRVLRTKALSADPVQQAIGAKIMKALSVPAPASLQKK